jgi:hypothetical protein
MIRTDRDDTSLQRTIPVNALFRKKIMIVIAKANCLNIHSFALESPTRLNLGGWRELMVYYLKDDVVAVVPFCFALRWTVVVMRRVEKEHLFFVFSRTRVSCHWLACLASQHRVRKKLIVSVFTLA